MASLGKDVGQPPCCAPAVVTCCQAWCRAPWGRGRCRAWYLMAALSTASMKYARPCMDRRSPVASWGSRARRPPSLLQSVMWWCCVACVTPRWTVVSSRCRGSPFRMWGVGVPVSASPTDLRRCTRIWCASRWVVVSWRMADACSMVVGSPAFSGSRWRVAVVRRLSSAKLMEGGP